MMKTPIINFVNNYKRKKTIRFHMPGHKGKKYLGFEDDDITEIKGADDLYHAKGIIKRSEINASKLYGYPTFFSTEGSSLAIRAMLYLVLSYRPFKEKAIILAARNAHKTFVTAAALLDFDVKWLYGKNSTYHSVNITALDVKEALQGMKKKPRALYLTSPDYLGHMLDIKGIKEVCREYNVILLVDNAHGAYLPFVDPKLDPINLGADMVASSAHKSLPTLTGGAFLQISNHTNPYFKRHAKEALGLFASTSPSYLILESLDFTVAFLNENKNLYQEFNLKLIEIKNKITSLGYTLIGEEPLKITFSTLDYGYSGEAFYDHLHKYNIEPEFYDKAYLVLMTSPFNDINDFKVLLKALSNLPKKKPLSKPLFALSEKPNVTSIKAAMLSPKKVMNVESTLGFVLADLAITCPPAVPIVIAGEQINEDDIKLFSYYDIKKISVVKK